MANFDLTNYINSSVINRTSVGGLASGIDTNSLIDKILDAESVPLKKLTAKKEAMTNRQKALNELSEELTEFRTFTNNWRLESSFLKYQTESTNESIATIQAAPPAKAKNFSFVVDQVARNETYFSAAYVSGNSSTQLQNLGGYHNGVSLEGALTLTVNGKTYDPISYHPSNTLSEVIAQIRADIPEVQVDTVNSAEGVKLFISGADASVDFSITDSGDFLQVMGMTTSYESGFFANGKATNTLANFDGPGTGITANGQLTIRYNGSDIHFDYETTQTLADLLNEINTDPTLAGKVDVYYATNNTGDALALYIQARNLEDTLSISDAPGAGSKGLLEMLYMTESLFSSTGVDGESGTTTLQSLGVVDGRLTLSVNGVDYFVDYTSSGGTEVLDDVIDAINSTDDLKDSFHAWAEERDGRMYLHLDAKNTDVSISVADNSNLLEVFHIDPSKATGYNPGALRNGTFHQTAREAQITVDVNGVSTTVTSASNLFENLFDGISVTVKRASSERVYASVGQDIDGMMDHMKEFIEKYNEVMNNLYLRMNPPETDNTRTDDEKLTEEQKAIKGALKNDPVVRDIFNRLRSLVYSDLDGSNHEVYYSTEVTGKKTDLLSAFGITGGALTVTVTGSSTPYTIEYHGTDTVQSIVDKFRFLNPAIHSKIQEGNGVFSVFVNSTKDFNIVDTPTGESLSFRDFFLNQHSDPVLTYDFLTDIGVGSSDGFTGGYLKIVKGQIMLDETRFRNALETDAEAVWKTFGASEVFGDTTVKGFATQLSDRLYDITKFGSGYIAQTAGTSGSISNQLRVVNQQIISLSQRLSKRYEALMAKFSFMEKTIQAWQRQSDYITKALEKKSGG